MAEAVELNEEELLQNKAMYIM